MKRPLTAAALAAAWLTAFSAASAREWTSADGRKLEAEFLSSSGDSVTLKRSDDGREFTLPLARLSPADREWIKSQAAKPAAPGAATAVSGPYARLLTGDWALSEFKNLPFALYGATSLDPAKKYPVVLALHGKSSNNENGRQVGGWAKSFTKDDRYKKNPCIIVAPLCYQPFGGSGGGWSDRPGEEAIDLIKDLEKNLPLVDRERVYVIGHSMGGFGVCHLMARESRLFAAGIPVSGYGSVAEAGDLKRKPIWLFHAADDQTVKVDGAREFAEALKRAKTFKYTEFPDGGHGIIGRVFDDEAVHTWLFAAGKASGS